MLFHLWIFKIKLLVNCKQYTNIYELFILNIQRSFKTTVRLTKLHFHFFVKFDWGLWRWPLSVICLLFNILIMYGLLNPFGFMNEHNSFFLQNFVITSKLKVFYNYFWHHVKSCSDHKVNMDLHNKTLSNAMAVTFRC